MNFDTLLRTKTTDHVAGYLSSADPSEPTTRKTVETGQDYLSIHIVAMRLVNVRVGFSKLYAMAHSEIEVQTALT